MDKPIKLAFAGQAGLVGIYTLTLADTTSAEAKLMSFAIDNLFKIGLVSLAKRMLKRFNEKFEVEKVVVKNMVPTVGLTIFAKTITNNLGSIAAGAINYTAVGTSSTAAVLGDTQLGTETFRKAISSLAYSNGIGYATAFYTATDFNGTIKEHALFCNGTGSANSGTLLSRIILNGTTGVTKTSTQSLTIDYEITFANA